MPRRSSRLKKKEDVSCHQEIVSSLIEEQCDTDATKNDDCIANNAEEEIEIFPTSATVESDSESLESDSDIESLADTFVESLRKQIELKQINRSIDHHTIAYSNDFDNMSSSIDVGNFCTDGYLSFDAGMKNEDRKGLNISSPSKVDDELLKRSKITSDVEAKTLAPQASQRSSKKLKRLEKNSTSGRKWFNMKAPEMTEQVKRDLKILQMRSILDPKRFYKKNDRKTFPKYFQIGKIMDNSADFYSSRLPKKQRKATLADELLADANFKRYQKRKYNEIQAKRRATGGSRYFNKKRLKKGRS